LRQKRVLSRSAIVAAVRTDGRRAAAHSAIYP
jgi:hypothetical protein